VLAGRLKDLGIDLIDVSSGGLVPKARIPVSKGYQVPLARKIRAEAEVMTGTVWRKGVAGVNGDRRSGGMTSASGNGLAQLRASTSRSPSLEDESIGLSDPGETAGTPRPSAGTSGWCAKPVAVLCPRLHTAQRASWPPFSRARIAQSIRASEFTPTL
jgi:hypothetical protein